MVVDVYLPIPFDMLCKMFDPECQYTNCTTQYQHIRYKSLSTYSTLCNTQTLYRSGARVPRPPLELLNKFLYFSSVSVGLRAKTFIKHLLYGRPGSVEAYCIATYSSQRPRVHLQAQVISWRC